MTNRIWPDPSIVGGLAAVRSGRPLVYGLTNYIAAQLSANVLLAVGASPAIGGMPAASEHFAAIAGGVWINLAALVTDEPDILIKVAKSANAAGTPWVLDPVTVGAGAVANDRVAAELIALKPTGVRGNASEVIALAGGTGGTKGVDSTATSEEAIPFAQALARKTGGVVAVSGPIDYVTDGERVVAVPGGHPNLTRVTGTGCSLGGLVAAFAAVVPDKLDAAVAAHAVLATAAERAARVAPGTGTFAVALLDELSQLEAA